MIPLFVSHAWTETTEYEAFTCALDRALGGQWTNCSVPRNQAIDILADEERRRKDRLPWLEEELWRAEVRLQDPKLPKIFGSRYVYRNGELREVPSVDTVKAEIESLRGQIAYAKLERKSPKELETHTDGASISKNYFGQTKYLSAYVGDFPALSGAIRDRIGRSELVFLLLTPMIIPNRWVYYEFSMCSNLGIPVVGVRLPSTSGFRDLELQLSHVIDSQSSEIDREIVECIDSIPEWRRNRGHNSRYR